MDEMWGESVVKLRVEDAKRGQLFSEGNYAMFIHWGVYSQLANKVDGKTYYGIGEWIMNSNLADIPVDEYKEIAKSFNPVKFDAMEIAQLAKDAGMKYIIITSKHHDGFAMYHSKANKFNIVDATQFDRDLMKELSAACQKLGLGFGFYYSHNQDWTFPGGGNGPKTDAAGNKATFDDYFKNKCLPQVKEITSEYGPITLVWFDTPGDMPKHYVEQLVEVVRKNQPEALVSGRAGHGLGDYQTLGDMELPHQNVEGLWEAVDTTNDSWGYAWYDENWKTPKMIVENLITCVSRGGTYMLNIGPRGDGIVPERAASSLRESGKWIKRYPQVVYGTEGSPWQHALPWGDVTVKGKRMYLSIFEWPAGGSLYLPGLKTKIRKAKLLGGKWGGGLKFKKVNGWVEIKIPDRGPEKLVSVIELELADKPEVDDCWSIDPVVGTDILAQFAEVEGAKSESKNWMEKFGEWKHVIRVTDWQEGGKATWEVDVLEPGDYQVGLTYAGEGRLVWQVAVEGGEVIRNQQNSSHNYQRFPMGRLNFPKTGRYKVSVSCLEGNMNTACLKAIHFMPIL
ncbi:MAG: alpha-L-fucosidase [Planctomycetes bacterium]|nr:alpha-L-fucosidase [Planctomycetota bacterium]MBL7106181.1 alpha-L-fucosidase [Phycisphaerae bacterium]